MPFLNISTHKRYVRLNGVACTRRFSEGLYTHRSSLTHTLMRPSEYASRLLTGPGLPNLHNEGSYKWGSVCNREQYALGFILSVKSSRAAQRPRIQMMSGGDFALKCSASRNQLLPNIYLCLYLRAAEHDSSRSAKRVEPMPHLSLTHYITSRGRIFLNLPAFYCLLYAWLGRRHRREFKFAHTSVGGVITKFIIAILAAVALLQTPHTASSTVAARRAHTALIYIRHLFFAHRAGKPAANLISHSAAS
jgi:hypothetical protein